MTPLEIAQLPYIFQLIQLSKDTEKYLMELSNGWSGFAINGHKLINKLGYHLFNSDRVYVNHEENDKFIVCPLSSKRYAFKPNLHEHRFLFRGQNKVYDKIQSSFSRGNDDDHLISNIKCGDFICLLRSHPLFIMFERGIHLEPEKKPFFFEMNYFLLSKSFYF